MASGQTASFNRYRSIGGGGAGVKFGKVAFGVARHPRSMQLPDLISGLWLGGQQTPHELTLSAGKHLPSMSRT
jgi:hypothetical protein